MSFRITGLDPAQFRRLFGLPDGELAAHGARRYIADAQPGFPDRIELRDAEPGESLLLLNHTHQPADTPYRSSHAIFVAEGAFQAFDKMNEIPEPLRVRAISLRAFDAAHEMVSADLIDGGVLEEAIATFFENPDVAYLHAHCAKRGCFAARIDRA